MMDFEKSKIMLTEISETFCMAKWYRTNLRLYNGTSYSCHHCVPRKINLEKLETDSTALTNTDEIKEYRQEMLDGKRPSECSYCWAKEDAGVISDRIIKSRDIIDKIKLDPGSTSQSLSSFPKILDVAWDNTCNFKCSYCGPENSSMWVEEIERFGQYPTQYKKKSLESVKKEIIPNREHNPYIEAFWKWWDEGLAENLYRLTITGGEPLLSKNTFKVLDRIVEQKLNMMLNINTNLCVPNDVFDNFITKIQSDKLKTIQISTSIESTGDKAEYSRYGLDYNKWLSNVHTILNMPKAQLHIGLTNNALSYTDFYSVINLVIELKQKYGRDRLFVSSNEAHYPHYLDLRILPDKLKSSVNKSVKTLLEKNRDLFRENEITKIERTIQYSMSEVKNKSDRIKDFRLFVKEYDKRREVDSKVTFPELRKFIK